MTRWAPTFADRSSASFRLRLRLCSKVDKPTVAKHLRRHVDLDVELTQLGLEVGVGDGGQDLGVLQRRIAVLVDQIELHLQARHRVVGVEACLAKHPGEHVQADTDLLAVTRSVSPAELLRFHLFAHAGTLRLRAGSAIRRG